MNRMMQMTPALSATHLMTAEVEGVIAGFGLIRTTDGRVPGVARRQRRRSRHKRH